jgi:predicted  nucleic acid-binding Zn-ribbon protein
MPGVSLSEDTRPAFVEGLAKCEAERNTLQRELEANQQSLQQIAGQLAELEPELKEARAQQKRAQQRLEALSFSAERLPGIVSQDERYQRLKAEYETAVLNGSQSPEHIRAQARLKSWVENIYRPELEAEVELADRRLAALVEEPQEFLQKQRALEAQRADQQTKLNASMDRLRQLESLLN